RDAARRLTADEPRPIGFLVLRHARQLRVQIERGLVAPCFDQNDAALIVLRQQYVELLATVLGAREPPVTFHHLAHSIAVFRLHLKFDDDNKAAHRRSLRRQSTASSAIGRNRASARGRFGEISIWHMTHCARFCRSLAGPRSGPDRSRSPATTTRFCPRR